MATLNEPPDLSNIADAARYSLEKAAAVAWNNAYSGPSINSLLGSAQTATQAAMFNGIQGSVVTPPYEDLLKRLDEVEKNMTHIEVAKDQENRICELEGAVTELMEFMKEQLKLIEETKRKATEELQKAMDLSNAYQARYAQMASPQSPPNYQPGMAFQTSAGSSGLSGLYPTIGGGVPAGLSNLQAAHTHVTSAPIPTSKMSTHDVIGIAKRALGFK